MCIFTWAHAHGQASVKKGEHKPRGRPWYGEQLTQTYGRMLLMCSLSNPTKRWTGPKAPPRAMKRYTTMDHSKKGSTAWMCSRSGVVAQWLNNYNEGQMEDYCEDMTVTTLSKAWPPMGMHEKNLEADMSMSLHLEPHPPRPRVIALSACACVRRSEPGMAR